MVSTGGQKIDVALVGIGVDPDNEEPDMYVAFILDLVTCQDRPFTSEGYILLLPSIAHFPKALSLAGLSESSVVSVPVKEAMVVDIAQVMYLLLEEESGNSGIILNLLNTFFDLVAATPFDFPNEYKSVLFRFAAYLTTNDNFGPFFDNIDVDRPTVINGIIWLVGAVFSNAKFVR